jgi:hypothetical protein
MFAFLCDSELTQGAGRADGSQLLWAAEPLVVMQAVLLVVQSAGNGIPDVREPAACPRSDQLRRPPDGGVAHCPSARRWTGRWDAGVRRGGHRRRACRPTPFVVLAGSDAEELSCDGRRRVTSRTVAGRRNRRDCSRPVRNLRAHSPCCARDYIRRGAREGCGSSLGCARGTDDRRAHPKLVRRIFLRIRLSSEMFVFSASRSVRDAQRVRR